MFLNALFSTFDANKNGALTRAELQQTFGKWFGEWDREKRGSLTEENLRDGLTAVLPRPDFGGPGGPDGGGAPRRDGPGGGQGRNRGPQVNGVELDPLYCANDAEKPLHIV